MQKLTRDNYEAFIDKWVDGDRGERDVAYEFHDAYTPQDIIKNYATAKGVVVLIREYDGHIKRISFVRKSN